MKKITFLFLMFIGLITNITYSQNVFEKGYIITNENQKIDCLIKNRDWINSPREIEYKLSENSNIEITNFTKIQSFQIYNTPKFFKKEIVEIDKNTDKKEHNLKKESVILKVLIEGNTCLYKNDENLFFYQKESGDIKQLIYKKYTSESSKIEEDFSFRKELYNNFKCSNINVLEIRKINYQKRSLVDFFRKYNECINTTFTDYTKNQIKLKLNLKGLTGINFYNIETPIYREPITLYSGTPSTGYNAVGKIPEELFYEAKTNSTNFVLGFETEILLPFNKQKWSIFTAPNYQQQKNEGLKSSIFSVDYKGTITMKNQYSYIGLPVGIRHYFNLSEKSKLFLDVAYKFILFTKKTETNSFEPTKNPDNLPKLKTYKSTGSIPEVGFGYSFKNKYYLAARYSPKIKLSESEVSSFSLIASYKLL